MTGWYVACLVLLAVVLFLGFLLMKMRSSWESEKRDLLNRLMSMNFREYAVFTKTLNERPEVEQPQGIVPPPPWSPVP